MITNKICQKCSKEMKQVHHNRKYCEKCSIKIERTDNRFREDIGKRKDEIVNLYNNNNGIIKIATMMNCDFSVIRRILLKNDIKIKPTNFYIKGREPYNKMKLDKRKILRLYYEKKSMTDIAKIMDCSLTVIKRILNENKIKLRESRFYLLGKPAWNKVYLSEDKVISLYNQGDNIKSIARLVNGTFDSVKNILTKNNISIRPFNFYRKGKKSSEETKIKQKEVWNRPGYKDKWKLIMSTVVIPKQDTSIEIKIQSLLKQLGIDFFTHQYISKISHAYQCDILINPQPNFMSEKKTIIECDGDYWHCNPIKFPNPNQMQKEQIEEDACRNEELRFAGFEVIRLWESDIKKMDLNKFKEILYEKIPIFS